jgi:type II secretory pathway component PulL
MLKFSALAFVLTVAAPLPALAYTQADADACTPDAFRLCQRAIPDASRVADCLAQNRQRLSPACHAVFSRPADASLARERPERIERTGY